LKIAYTVSRMFDGKNAKPATPHDAIHRKIALATARMVDWILSGQGKAAL